jgi:site-specific DNA recombinase
VIRRIFAEYAASVSPRAIAAGLSRDNIPSPRGAENWNHKTILGGGDGGIIGNRLYIGELVWNKQYTVTDPEPPHHKSKRPHPASERIVTTVEHLRIVPAALWEAAQAVRKGRQPIAGPGGTVTRRTIPRKPWLLSGLLRCGECQGGMIIVSVSRGNRYVACAAAHMKSACAHRRRYDIDILQATVLDGLRQNPILDPEALTETVKAFQKNQKQDNTERLVAEKQLDRLTGQIKRLVDAIADGDGSVKEVMAALKAKDAERAALAERIRLLKASNVVSLHPTMIEDYRAAAARFLTIDSHDADGQAAFRKLLDCVVVHAVAKGAPYEVTPYGKLATMLRAEFPSGDTGKQGLPFRSPPKPL